MLSDRDINFVLKCIKFLFISFFYYFHSIPKPWEIKSLCILSILVFLIIVVSNSLYIVIHRIAVPAANPLWIVEPITLDFKAIVVLIFEIDFWSRTFSSSIFNVFKHFTTSLINFGAWFYESKTDTSWSARSIHKTQSFFIACKTSRTWSRHE